MTSSWAASPRSASRRSTSAQRGPRAGWPESVPATTIDRQCGSSQQALHFAARASCRAYDVVVAAGVEVMSRVPWAHRSARTPVGLRSSVAARYERSRTEEPGHRRRDDRRSVDVSRDDLDAFSAESHRRAPRRPRSRFEREIVRSTSVTKRTGTDELMTTDEGIRPDSTSRRSPT